LLVVSLVMSHDLQTRFVAGGSGSSATDAHLEITFDGAVFFPITGIALLNLSQTETRRSCSRRRPPHGQHVVLTVDLV
jgi:hypothetical protein